MKRVVLLAIIIFAICSAVSAQKLAEPKLLGNWIAGEDPSEFLLHKVMEYSQNLLQENPDGKLIVRICSSDEFSTAFIKAPLNPLSASYYNQFRLLVPNEKIYIARSSKCLGKNKYVHNQYWFVPDRNTIEYEEIFPVNDIYYKSFETGEFDENLKTLIKELKNNPKANGFIVHNSSSRKLKRNLEKVKRLAQNEALDVKKIKIVKKVRLESGENGKLIETRDKNTFPTLVLLEIRN